MSDIPLLLHELLASRYVLKREIGRGGAATVYLAHDLRHERLVAIKVLHPELSHALGAQRFLREIKLTASLQHPHILPIHDSGEADEQLFYVMPYVEGDSLRQRLGAGNRLSVEETVRIGREVLGALAYAHERGVVHRDIKPENILFSGGHAVLADFGIARAINRASGTITRQGTITGTPAYMSPEQARDRAFDGRSDVYSLSCVLYEAIAGVPPYMGDTAELLLSKRVAHRAPLLREYRHDVPAAIESVIARALSIEPDDRYGDARTFSAALSAAVGNSGETLATTRHRRPLVRSPWLWAAGVSLAVAGGAATTPSGRDRIDVLTRRVDTARYAVLPFQYVGVAAPLRELEPAAGATYDALRRWDGLPLASEMSVSDAVRARGDGPLTVDEVMRIARGVRAGRVVWGRVRVTADSIMVRVALYDALTGDALREVTRVLPAGGAGGLSQVDFRSLVDELLRGTRAPALSAGADRATASFPAWQAFERGSIALAHWDMTAAASDLERASEADPGYPQAHLWLAQLRFLQGASPERWKAPLMTAQHGRLLLDPRERALADALSRLAASDAPAACAAFADLRTRDSLDAMAWISLAMCHAQDNEVVPDSRATGSLAFRSNPEVFWTTATHALELAPEAFAVLPYANLRRIFPIERNVLRIGTRRGEMYAAWPELDGDSVVYRPVAGSAVSTHSVTERYEAALRRNQDRMLGLLETLTRRMPENPDAFEALTAVLEARGEISGTPNGRYSALAALERARMLAVEPDQRLRLALADLRLHLKLGDFARSAALADSVLRAHDSPTAVQAGLLSGVAAYAGRPGLAARYDRMRATPEVRFGVPDVPAAEDAIASLVMRTALGVCDDTVQVLVRSIDRTLASYVEPARRPLARERILERPMMLSAPCANGRGTLEVTTPTGWIVRAEQLIARGDRVGARRLMDSVTLSRRGRPPGAMSLDVVVLDAWVRDAYGDARGAADRLDVVLSALPTLTTNVTLEPSIAAAVGRSMTYRAELAQRLNDPATAAIWAGRVLTLWAHAEPGLAPVMARMRLLAVHQPSRQSAQAAEVTP